MYKVLVSACLLGERVRYDGGQKLLPLLRNGWGEHLTFIPICPEVEAGLSTPREPIDLFLEEDGAGKIRALGKTTGSDFAPRLGAWCAQHLTELEKAIPDGFILKSRSPSCATKLWLQPTAGAAAPVPQLS